MVTELAAALRGTKIEQEPDNKNKFLKKYTITGLSTPQVFKYWELNRDGMIEDVISSDVTLPLFR